MKPIKCAGLTWQGACPKQAQCANHAAWWKTEGVQFNACRDGDGLRHFAPMSSPATTPPRISQQDLFA